MAYPHEATLTIDRAPFTTPAEAFGYVCENRVLSRFVTRLDKAGWLSSPCYIWVLEFQCAAWPHWHMIVDAKPQSVANPRPFIPYRVIRGAWRLGITKAVGRTPQQHVDYLDKCEQKTPPYWAEELGIQLRWYDHSKEKHCAHFQPSV